MNTRDIDVTTLEFLSGPHEGRTVGLPAGRHVLGTHRHAHIRLSDKTAAGFAGYLDIAGTRATLTLRQPGAPAGSPRVGAETAMPITNETFTVGATRMRILHDVAHNVVQVESAPQQVESVQTDRIDTAGPTAAELRHRAMEHIARLDTSARTLIGVCAHGAKALIAASADSLGDTLTELRSSMGRARIALHAAMLSATPRASSLQALLRDRLRTAADRFSGLPGPSRLADVVTHARNHVPPIPVQSAIRRAHRQFDALIARPAVQTAAAAVAVCTLIAVASLTTFDQVNATAADPIEPQTLAALVETELAENTFSGVHITGSSPDSIQLAGLVDTAAERKRIERLFDGRPFSVDLRKLKTGSDIANTITEVFAQLGYPGLSAQSDGAGDVAINGYVSSPADWREVQALLRRDFPGIGRIDANGVAFLETRLNALRTMLDAAHIERAVHTTTAGDDILVEGTLAPKGADQWRQVKRDFVDRYGHSPRLVEDIAIKKPPEPPKIEIAGSVVSATKSFCITADGQVYKPGETMADGSVVQRIGTKQVTVTNNGGEFVLPVKVKG